MRACTAFALLALLLAAALPAKGREVPGERPARPPAVPGTALTASAGATAVGGGL